MLFSPVESTVVALIQALTAAGTPPPEAGICKRVLSIHDHRLSEEEAAGSTVSFSTFGSLWEYRLFLSEEEKFVNLFAFLFRSNDLFCLDAANTAIVPLESWQQLIDLTTAGLREKETFFLYVPRFQVVLASAFDLNVAVYFLDCQHQSTFAELTRAYQLYLF